MNLLGLCCSKSVLAWCQNYLGSFFFFFNWYFFNCSIFNLRIITLQYCVGFCHTQHESAIDILDAWDGAGGGR